MLTSKTRTANGSSCFQRSVPPVFTGLWSHDFKLVFLGLSSSSREGRGQERSELQGRLLARGGGRRSRLWRCSLQQPQLLPSARRPRLHVLQWTPPREGEVADRSGRHVRAKQVFTRCSSPEFPGFAPAALLAQLDRHSTASLAQLLLPVCWEHLCWCGDMVNGSDYGRAA